MVMAVLLVSIVSRLSGRLNVGRLIGLPLRLLQGLCLVHQLLSSMLHLLDVCSLVGGCTILLLLHLVLRGLRSSSQSCHLLL